MQLITHNLYSTKLFMLRFSFMTILMAITINTFAQAPAFEGHMALPGVKLWYEGHPGVQVRLLY